jgi:hypothetical protein
LFPDRPNPEGPKLVVVNHRFAKRYFPQGGAVGKLIKARPTTDAVEDKDWFHIVGVIGNIRTELRNLNPLPEVYQAWGQAHWPLAAFVVRTNGDPLHLVSAMRKAAAEVDPSQPVDDLQPMTRLLSSSAASERVQTGLLTSFAFAALMLASLGLYGLLTGEVARRTQEFGVRIALGARRGNLLLDALGRGMKLVFIGLLLGIAGAVGVGQLLRNLLYEVQPGDWFSVTVAAVVLAAVGLMACGAPAYRASRVDPLTALRHE